MMNTRERVERLDFPRCELSRHQQPQLPMGVRYAANRLAG